jgi:hypothetical protein
VRTFSEDVCRTIRASFQDGTFSFGLLDEIEMTTDHIVALLIAERDRLNRAIEALQGPVRRTGRSPQESRDCKHDAGTYEEPTQRDGCCGTERTVRTDEGVVGEAS